MEKLYADNKIIGEMILDTTASKNDKLNQIIMLRYPNKLAFKVFNEGLENLKDRLKINRTSLEDEYAMHKNNLKEI